MLKSTGFSDEGIKALEDKRGSARSNAHCIEGLDNQSAEYWWDKAGELTDQIEQDSHYDEYVNLGDQVFELGILLFEIRFAENYNHQPVNRSEKQD